jgi:hypothetical protein
MMVVCWNTNREREIIVSVATESTSVINKQTVLDRLMDAGITEARALEHVRRGAVLVDGHVITDPTSDATRPARIDIRFVRRADDEA